MGQHKNKYIWVNLSLRTGGPRKSATEHVRCNSRGGECRNVEAGMGKGDRYGLLKIQVVWRLSAECEANNQKADV